MKYKCKFQGIVLPLVFVMFSASLESAGQESGNDNVTISGSGWTISADPLSEQLVIFHDSLGAVLKDIRLNSVQAGKVIPLREWTAGKAGESKLAIVTKNPSSAWTFELSPDNVIISASTAELCITARAPATSERVVARLLDTEGVPVTWRGTDEVTVSWQGKDTQRPSYLPAVNPDVMTFALGQIDANNLHSLFDRQNDIAIDFPQSSLMRRDPQDNSLLDMTIPVQGKAMIRLIPSYYTGKLGLPYYSRIDDSRFPSAPVIWGSWTAYYSEVTESDIVRNADWISKNLKPYGFQYVQLDDGYDRGKPEGHYWIENWNMARFPHGPEWLAGYIKSKGLHAGLWLVPNSYAGAIKSHPDWYLYDKSGKVIMDYMTPALDHTNPGVQEWLRKLFTTLGNWGFDYFKFDGELSLPAYVPDLDTSRLFDRKTDPLTAYRNRLKLIRSVTGPGTFIEGCVAGSPLNGIGYFNSCFNGADMYNSWKGSYAVFSSINANAFLNHMAIYVMPGEGIDVSPSMSAEESAAKMVPRAIEVARTREDPFTGFGVTMAEARTLVSVISLTGVVYPLTSIMPDLPAVRVSLLKKTMPTLPVLPVDLFSRGSDITWDKFKFTTPDTYIHNYPEIIDLKVNAVSGVYDVAAFTNWRGEKVTRQVSLSEKLGLEKGERKVVFDFWNGKIAGICSDTLSVEIEPHDTRVLLIHTLTGSPQLIAISRHISGAYSVLGLSWDSTVNILSGTSGTISGEPYSLFVYVPEGMKLLEARALSAENNRVSCVAEQSGSLLKITVEAPGDRITWQAKFSGGSK